VIRGKSEEDPAAEGMFLHDNIPKLFRMRIAGIENGCTSVLASPAETASPIAIAGKTMSQVSEYSASNASKNGLSRIEGDSPT